MIYPSGIVDEIGVGDMRYSYGMKCIIALRARATSSVRVIFIRLATSTSAMAVSVIPTENGFALRTRVLEELIDLCTHL